jgi:hypothetical protein
MRAVGVRRAPQTPSTQYPAVDMKTAVPAVEPTEIEPVTSCLQNDYADPP